MGVARPGAHFLPDRAHPARHGCNQVACETCTKDNMVMVFGEITTTAKLDYDKIVRNEVRGRAIGLFSGLPLPLPHRHRPPLPL